MKCPHCTVTVHEQTNTSQFGQDADGSWTLLVHRCPACNRYTIEARQLSSGNQTKILRLYPSGQTRPPLSTHVPNEFTNDYNEAAITLPLSAKASAALSRRCLQHVLREKFGVKKADLASEIQEVINAAKLPSPILESLDAVRNIGNFAAHPMKSQSTGEILDVEMGEAEWTLDVLDSIFDYVFVQPEILKAKRVALDKRLADAGKPPMK